MIHFTPSWSVPPWLHARYPWTAACVQTLSSVIRPQRSGSPDNWVWRSWILPSVKSRTLFKCVYVEAGCWRRRRAGPEGWAWAEDEDDVAAVVLNGEVKLVLNGMGQSESVALSGGFCVRTVALSFYFVLADARQVVAFLKSWLNMNNWKHVNSSGYRKRILHENVRTYLLVCLSIFLQ